MLTGGNDTTKTWRSQLIQFINEQQGSYIDKKWQLDYYEEFKTVGLGDKPTEKIIDHSQEASTPTKDLSLKEVQKQKLASR